MTLINGSPLLKVNQRIMSDKSSFETEPGRKSLYLSYINYRHFRQTVYLQRYISLMQNVK